MNNKLLNLIMFIFPISMFIVGKKEIAFVFIGTILFAMLKIRVEYEK